MVEFKRSITERKNGRVLVTLFDGESKPVGHWICAVDTAASLAMNLLSAMEGKDGRIA